MGEFQEQRDGNRERRKATGLNRLTARKVASITRKGRHADGGGLYLQVDGKGAKQWVFLFQRNGRRREMGLGGVSAITLAKARELAAACRADLAAGRDPLQLRREVKEAEQAEHEAAARVEDSRFGAVAEAMLKAKESGWRNAKHRQQWRNTLATYAAPLWDMPVADIKTEHVLECLEPIWTTKSETASRVRGRIENVLNAARARGLLPEDRANPARWRGHLDHLLAKRHRLTRGHHAALPYSEIAALVAKLREREAVTARCLEFIILTAARSGEARGMTWDEVDLASRIWTVPAERMKAGRPHRVPLSERAAEILESQGASTPDALIFPGARAGRPLSDMAFKALFERLAVSGITVHGFRSTFRDWVSEETDFARELAEAALAHTLESKVEAAYRRGDALEKRRALMNAWADYVCGAADIGYGPA